jgi:SAM-dependent methyltransferase
VTSSIDLIVRFERGVCRGVAQRPLTIDPLTVAFHKMLLHLTILSLSIVLVEIGAFVFSSSLSSARSSPRSIRGDTFTLAQILPRIPVGSVFFCTDLDNRGRRTRTCLLAAAAKGIKKGDRRASSSSGGGFGAAPPPPASSSSSVSQSKKANQKGATAKRLQKVYGGTSPQDIAAGTQRRVESAFQNLPSHLKVATTLYQRVTLWDLKMSQLSLLQRSQLSPMDVEDAERARRELEELCDRHNLTSVELHNTFQRITWDSSADAKAARAIASNNQVSADVAAKIDRACAIVAEAVLASAENGRCLDVGCGYGVLVPHLVKAGVAPEQIVGIDLSPEMIRNAQELHGSGTSSSNNKAGSGKSRGGGRVRAPTFVAGDFLNEYDDVDGFDGILFCASLHDMPDPTEALAKACRLLRPGGVLVAVHPQGASHVRKQHSQNPILVRRNLPDPSELQALTQTTISNMELVTAPAPDGSLQDSNEGYLFVLQKKR